MGISKQDALELEAIELEGTCDNASADLELIANELDIYRCETCGWWHESGDIYDISECTECHDEKSS